MRQRARLIEVGLEIAHRQFRGLFGGSVGAAATAIETEPRVDPSLRSFKGAIDG
jgi:hypothetical protein